MSPAILAVPPLNTGDTDVIAPETWEIIVAATADERDAGDSYELPGGEITRGLTTNTQATLSYSRAVVDMPGESSRSDFGPFSVEYLWRFYNQDKLSFAVAPSYEFPINSSSQRRGTADSTRTLGLPLILGYMTDDWFINTEASYAVTSSGPNGIGYGLAGGYALTDAWQVVAEINGGESSGGDDDRELNWRVGGIWQFAEAFALLAAVGGNLDSDLPAAEQLHQDFYLGIQYNTK